MSLKNKVVVVTGGAGFVGSHLVDAIIKEEPEKIVVLDNYFLGWNNNLKCAAEEFTDLYIVTQDITNLEVVTDIFSTHSPDVVFDLAVIPLPVSLDHPVMTYRQNIEMGITMAELARLGLYKTLIHFSSSEVYGTCVKEPMDETHPLNGRTTYAASKAAIDQLIVAYQHTFGIDASIIRPFNLYGPRQNMGSYAAVIPITIRRIMAHKKPIICGDGKQTRDYLYVSDVANAAIDMYTHKNTRGKVVNIASGKEVSINVLILKIMKVMEYCGNVEYRPERVADVRKHVADISLASSLIGFEPSVDFEQGLKKTVDWYAR